MWRSHSGCGAPIFASTKPGCLTDHGNYFFQSYNGYNASTGQAR
jgi:hypothetical protein